MYSSETIKTKDGYKIGIRVFLSEKETPYVILISPSAAASQQQYVDFATHFSRTGFHVVTYDYRGIGDSAPLELKGYRALLRQWAVQDTDAVMRHVKHHFPKHEFIFVGHGIGGEIVGLAPASQYVDKIVLVSAALSCSRLRRLKDRIWIGVMKSIVKFSSWLFGYFPGKFFGYKNNIPKGVMYEWIHWCNNCNGLFDDFPDHNYRKLQAPLLSFGFSDDWRSQKTGVEALLEHFQPAGITRYYIKPREMGCRRIGHSGFFKITSKKTLWPILLSWLQKDAVIESASLSTHTHKKSPAEGTGH